VTVAGGVAARLGGRLSCVFFGVDGRTVSGVCTTVDAAGAIVCALSELARHITAVTVINNISNRGKNIFMVLLKNIYYQLRLFELKLTGVRLSTIRWAPKLTGGKEILRVAPRSSCMDTTIGLRGALRETSPAFCSISLTDSAVETP